MLLGESRMRPFASKQKKQKIVHTVDNILRQRNTINVFVDQIIFFKFNNHRPHASSRLKNLARLSHKLSMLLGESKTSQFEILARESCFLVFDVKAR